MVQLRNLFSDAARRRRGVFLVLATTSVALCTAQPAPTADKPPLSVSTEETQTTPTAKKESRKKDEPARLLAPVTWGGAEGKDYRLLLGGENQARYESRDDYGGILRTEDDDNLGFVRTRAHADLLYKDVVRAYLEVLDGRVVDPNYEYNRKPISTCSRRSSSSGMRWQDSESGGTCAAARLCARCVV